MINSLKKLGLNRYEAQAYIGLTKIITGQADEIAEVSNLPRSRIYDILNQLENKGFVEITRSRPLRYTVIEPTVIFKQEKENLIDELQSTEK
ncbi:MAG: helix-turn-helix domain-containing protein, partial [Methanobrevibacter sp.]|nr:helix-turn-helix domain-containing protein [Methanobrevibacter sp.]